MVRVNGRYPYQAINIVHLHQGQRPKEVPS